MNNKRNGDALVRLGQGAFEHEVLPDGEAARPDVTAHELALFGLCPFSYRAHTQGVAEVRHGPHVEPVLDALPPVMDASLRDHKVAGPMLASLVRGVTHKPMPFRSGDHRLTVQACPMYSGVFDGRPCVAHVCAVDSLDNAPRVIDSSGYALRCHLEAKCLGGRCMWGIVAVESSAPYRTGVFSPDVPLAWQLDMYIERLIARFSLAKATGTYPSAFAEAKPLSSSRSWAS